MNKLNLIEHQTLFLENLENTGKSFNTLKNYKTDLNIFNQFLIQKGRKLSLGEITHTEVEEYSYFLEKKYNSPNSIRRRVQALRIFFDYLISKEIFDKNPIKTIISKPKIVDLPNPAPFDQIQKLIAKLYSIDDKSSLHEKLLNQRNLVLIYLIYGAGLKVSDIERLNNYSLKLVKGVYRILVSPPKRDPFTVLMPENFTDIYHHYQELLDEGKERDHIEFDDLLFNGNPFKIIKGGLSARGIEVIFKEFSKNNEMQITAKSLRQSCIFKWLCQDIPQARIKEWMGVQPQYSLNPYIELLKQNPEQFCFMEL